MNLSQFAYDFLKVSSEEELILELQNYLKKKSQIDYYDTIYQQHLQSHQILDFDQPVKGFSFIVRLAIISVYYRQKLNINEVNTPDCIEYLIKTCNRDDVINDELTFKNLYAIIHSLSMKIDLNVNSHKFIDFDGQEYEPTYSDLENCRLPFFGYIIINKNITFDDISEEFFNPNGIKWYLQFNLEKKLFSAHGENYVDPERFLHHDFGHFEYAIYLVNLFSFEDATKIRDLLFFEWLQLLYFLLFKMVFSSI